MSKVTIRHIINFIVFISLQVLIFNNIFFMGYINPYVYLMFLFLLPISKKNQNLLLLIAFLTGIVMDAFQNSMGLHTFACVLVMYLKSPILLSLIPQLKNKTQNNIVFSINEFGLATTIIYTSILVFIHHFALFFIEAFQFDLGNILLRTIASGIVTSILLIIFQFFNARNSLK
jgi:hypothetical protein|tara:strand:+ start:2261 stop:2782 length:522 start_codon:yes stop_codon:yes gene_type:complete